MRHNNTILVLFFLSSSWYFTCIATALIMSLVLATYLDWAYSYIIQHLGRLSIYSPFWQLALAQALLLAQA